MSEIYNDALNLSSEVTTSKTVGFWQIVNMLRRWWWLIGLIIVSLTAISAIILFRMTPIYKASSLLEVKQEERNVIDVSAVESVIVDKEFLTTQIELLKSESLIEDTIENLNLLSDSYLAPLDNETWVGLPRSDRIGVLISSFKTNLRVAPIGRSRLIMVSFEHSDPQKAARITNTLTENYIANGLARKFNATVYAREFLKERLTIVRASLEAAERDLVGYATKNNIIDGEDTQGSSGSLDKTALKTLNSELTKASIARVEAEIIYQQSLKGNFDLEVLSNNALTDLQSKRLELQSEYQESLAIYKPAYPEMVELKARIDLFDQEIAVQKEAITSSFGTRLSNDFALALAKEQDLSRRVNDLKSKVIDVREKSINYNILKRQVETERTQYEALLQRLKEVSVSDDLGSNLVEIVDIAKAPRNPFKPNRLRSLILAFLISSGIGFGAAYVFELVDDHVKGPEDVKNKLKQIIMGVIPVSKNPDNLLEELAQPQSSVSEAYASLRTNLQFSGPDGGPRVIQITSTRSGEGKSVSSLGTSLRFAGIGHKVLLVDADMRRPTFTSTQKSNLGLAGVLTQNVEFESVIESTTYAGLDLMPSGSIVPNPSELLANTRFDELLSWAKDNYDYVIVDSPPVLGLADAPILGAKVDATLLVIDSGMLRTPNIKASIERLQNSGTRILGAVLTKYKAQTKGYMDYYQYSYGQEATKYAKNSVRTNDSNNKSKRKFELN